MKCTVTLGGSELVLTKLDPVAVRPTADLRSTVGSSVRKLAARFGEPAADISSPNVSFGIGLAAKDRLLFQAAGWVFAEPTAQLARAANETRSTVADADAVRPVFMDRGGSMMVGTDLLTARLPADMTAAQVNAKLQEDGFRRVRKLGFAPNLFEIEFRTRKPFLEAIAEAQAKRGYDFIEPAFLEVIAGRWTPTDPDFGQQWQHRNNGANGGVAGADIKSEAAWDRTRGGITPNGLDRPVRIAVIDNSMQVNHADLKAGIVGGGYFTPDPAGTGGIFNPYTPGAAGFPNGHHGTFCMGMAGARANNGVGGCGSAPESALIPIACLGDQIGTQATLARAVAYAANPNTEDPNATAADGADVIACSLGPNGANWAITSVLNNAINVAATTGRGGLGTPIFWAVTNGSFEIQYDKVSSHPLVCAVGRSNRNDLEDGSGYGPELAFLAPGREVYSCTTSSKYTFDTGTSYAAPLAAGVGGLVISRNPGWTRAQVIDHLKATCDQIGGVVYNNGHHDDYGHGRINADRATV